MDSDVIVMRDSPEAAKPHKLDGWLSRHGRFYGDEGTARYDGCTHVACKDCSGPTPKGYLFCDACKEKKDLARYEAKPKAAWNGEFLYSDAYDQYFADPGEAEDSLEEGQTMADLRLVICKPNYVRPLESDYCIDEMAPDDEGSLPSEVDAAMDAFNKAVAGIVLSWSPGDTALLPATPKEPS